MSNTEEFKRVPVPEDGNCFWHALVVGMRKIAPDFTIDTLVEMVMEDECITMLVHENDLPTATKALVFWLSNNWRTNEWIVSAFRTVAMRLLNERYNVTIVIHKVGQTDPIHVAHATGTGAHHEVHIQQTANEGHYNALDKKYESTAVQGIGNPYLLLSCPRQGASNFTAEQFKHQNSVLESLGVK